MPAIGFSMGLSTLVGQSLGQNDVDSAIKYTKQTIYILMTYILLLDLLLFVAPDWILTVFIMADTNNALYGQLIDRGIVVMRIMAFFIAFDAMYFTFIGVLKGAGDTRFIMWSIGIVSLIVMILPLTYIIKYKGWGLFACWITLTIYVISLFLVSYLRYRQGKWKNIRVI
jgi:MATE family multidrug resistance protein